MPSVTILGLDVDLEFRQSPDAALQLDEPAIMTGLAEMAALINRTEWTPDQTAAFNLMEKIVFFEGSVVVNNILMDRPCCDEDDATFYWEGSEFMANPDPRVRANTYFHDCFHLVQFGRDGGFAMTRPVQVAREVEAIDRQIEVAQTLGCRPEDIQFLETFRDDQSRIFARLDEGVKMRQG